MNRLGLSGADFALYLGGIAESPSMRLSVFLHDKDEQEIASFTAPSRMVLDGQVDVSTSSEVSRTLSLDVLDPHRKLELDPYDSSPYGLFFDRYVSVVREDWITALDGYVPAPIFMGIIKGFDHSGEEVSIEAQGKDALLMEPATAWPGRNLPKGARTDWVIEELLRDGGEHNKNIEVPRIPGQLRKKMVVDKLDSRWLAAKRLANARGFELFYDGRGIAVCRKRSRSAVLQLTLERDLMEYPSAGYSDTDVRNLIEVIGGAAKDRTAAYARAVAPNNHPLSPVALARNGKPRYLVERVENSDITSSKECADYAEWLLARRLMMAVELEAQSAAYPCLEEYDWVEVEVEDGKFVPYQLDDFSLPCTMGDMAVGYHRWQGARGGRPKTMKRKTRLTKAARKRAARKRKKGKK